MKYLKILIPIFAVLFLNQALAMNEPSLRDKIAQMLIIGFEGKKVDKNSAIIKTINKTNIGGVILFDYNFRTSNFDKNIESPGQLSQLNSQLQKYTKLANTKYHRPPLPLFISVDYEGGAVNRLSSLHGFPETYPAAEVGKMTEREARQVAETMAKTLDETGINLNFAPDLDVNVNPDNPIIAKLGRSFSDDPKKVARYAAIFAQQFSKYKIGCAFKHFPGHGSANADSHLGFVDVSASWQEMELEPYKQLFAGSESCQMVMTAHIVNRQLDESGLPATLSPKILTGLLREQLQFDGVVITDDMQMKAISEHYSLDQALTLAINAGADMFIFGNQLSTKTQDPQELVDIIEEKVKSGAISKQRIDDAYRHILAYKNTLTNS